MTPHLTLPVLFAIIAALFACVGQAGGVGYVGVMGLWGFSPAIIKITALTLTPLVATIGIVRFHRMGLLKRQDWLAFALLGAPLSLLGGMLNLPGTLYRWVLAVLLLGAAIQMIRTARTAQALDQQEESAIPFLPALLTGAVTGLLAGISGVGAGVFLAPVMMALKWTGTRRTAAVAQASNLFTSLPALAGAWASAPALPPQLPWWALAAGAGGIIGSWLGAKHLPVTILRYILAAILIASGLKLAWG
jgi:uncharacterized membrane protein YfcA